MGLITLARDILSTRDMSSALTKEKSETSEEDGEKFTLHDLSPVAASNKNRSDVSTSRELRDEARLQSPRGSSTESPRRKEREASDSKAPEDEGDFKIR